MQSTRFQVIQPQGILDSVNSSKLRQEISETLDNGITTVLIDLKNVDFMDSSGLSALISAFKMIQSAGGKLYLCSIDQQIQMVLELTRMDRVFTVFANQDEFIRSL